MASAARSGGSAHANRFADTIPTVSTIPLAHPDITDEDVRLVTEVIRSGRLSMGPMLERFEHLVATRAGRPHGIGVSSGTAGLHLVLKALGVEEGDEVITPAFSFIASANCILYCNAKPVFIDCDPRTLNMDLQKVEDAITDKTRAIVGVEVFGNPEGMNELAAIATKHEIPLVEDACEGLGGRLGKTPIGGFGRAAVFGFYANKQITTGEGGMIVTHDDKLADACRSMRNQGRAAQSQLSAQDLTRQVESRRAAGGGFSSGGLGNWLSHERLGYNYRLSEIAAAMGVAQMNRLDDLIHRRQEVADAYTRCLGGSPDIMVPTVSPETFMSWFVYVVRLSDRFTADDRDSIIDGMRRHDIGASNYFPPIPLMPFYQKMFGFKPGDFPVAESISHRTLALPFFTQITDREVDLICQTVELMMQRTTFSR